MEIITIEYFEVFPFRIFIIEVIDNWKYNPWLILEKNQRKISQKVGHD